jgi:hypothetical protein
MFSKFHLASFSCLGAKTMSDHDDKKIIIDEDWKSQVQAEKEQQKRPKGESATGSAQTSATTGGFASNQPGAGDEMQIPPASFPFLVSSLATQAMFAMGQIPDPSTGQPVLDLDLAKHQIDMLAVLDEKTRGNLEDEEDQMLTEALHRLRLIFLAVQEQIA